MNWAPGALLALLLLAFPAVVMAQTPTETDTVSLDTAAVDTTLTETSGTVMTETVQSETVEPAETPSTTTYYEEDDEADDDDSSREGAAVCATCAAFGIAFPLIMLGISIAIAFWIYRDAKERGITSAALWAILGFLFNILGLVIYLIARKGMTPPGAPGSTMPPPPPPV
jgi:hypothetical protein